VKATLLLVIGYPVALAVLARLRSVLAERRTWWFAVLQAATAAIMVGWWLQGRMVAVLVNGAALAGFSVAWLLTGRRARLAAMKAR